MKRCTILAWLLLLALTVDAHICGADFVGRCVGVTDGDTVSVMRDGKAVSVRLEGIDCPESHQDYGAKAKEFTSGLCFGKDIEVKEKGTDRYGRTLGDVHIGDTWVNLELVKAGLAWHYKQYSDDKALADAESEARAGKVGLWSVPAPVAPWDFRHNPPAARAGRGDAAASQETTPQVTQAASAGDTTVYVTKSGAKYHADGCRYLSKSRIPIPLKEAVKKYAPCSVCKPPRPE